MDAALLDLWVALAVGYRRSLHHPEPSEHGHYWLRRGATSDGHAFACPRYSAMSSPRDVMFVVQRFKPNLDYRPSIGLWAASCPDAKKLLRTGFGKTFAEAVARAVVLAHFGDDPQLDTDDEPTDYDMFLNGIEP